MMMVVVVMLKVIKLWRKTAIDMTMMMTAMAM
jgi:hypothetical protein